MRKRDKRRSPGCSHLAELKERANFLEEQASEKKYSLLNNHQKMGAGNSRNTQKEMEEFQMILTDELCDRLCAAAREKSREVGIDIRCLPTGRSSEGSASAAAQRNRTARSQSIGG